MTKGVKHPTPLDWIVEKELCGPVASIPGNLQQSCELT